MTSKTTAQIVAERLDDLPDAMRMLWEAREDARQTAELQRPNSGPIAFNGRRGAKRGAAALERWQFGLPVKRLRNVGLCAADLAALAAGGVVELAEELTAKRARETVRRSTKALKANVNQGSAHRRFVPLTGIHVDFAANVRALPGPEFDKFALQLITPHYDAELGVYRVFGHVVTDFPRVAPELQFVLEQQQNHGWPHHAMVSLPAMDTAKSHRHSAASLYNPKRRFHSVVQHLNKLSDLTRFSTLDGSCGRLEWRFTPSARQHAISQCVLSELLERMRDAATLLYRTSNGEFMSGQRQQQPKGSHIKKRALAELLPASLGQLVEVGLRIQDLAYLLFRKYITFFCTSPARPVHNQRSQSGRLPLPADFGATLNKSATVMLTPTGAEFIAIHKLGRPKPQFDAERGTLLCDGRIVLTVLPRAWAMRAVLDSFGKANWSYYAKCPSYVPIFQSTNKQPELVNKTKVIKRHLSSSIDKLNAKQSVIHISLVGGGSSLCWHFIDYSGRGARSRRISQSVSRNARHGNHMRRSARRHGRTPSV